MKKLLFFPITILGFSTFFYVALEAALIQVTNGTGIRTTVTLVLDDNSAPRTKELEPGDVFEVNGIFAGFKEITYTDEWNTVRKTELSVPGLSMGITTLLIAVNGWLEIKGG